MTVQEIELSPAEYKAVENAAAQCGLAASEYARLTILGAIIGINVVNDRDTQRSLANAARTRL